MSISKFIQTSVAIFQLWQYERDHQVVDISIPALYSYWKNYYNSL